jgi:DNA-binding MarR family transcriptional regulator
MATPRSTHRPAKPDPARDPALRTVGRDALLVEGSDALFRQTIHNLMAIANSVDALRAGFAKLIGVSAPQHELLMLIYRANDGAGIGVGELAGQVKLSSAFVATETNKLSALGLIEKIPDEVDRRRVILHLTEFGRGNLAFLSAFQRQVNDVLFGCFDAEAFRQFSAFLEQVVPCSERAGDLVTLLARDHERTAQVSMLSPATRKRSSL